jgi:beta-hydroxylase
MPKIQLVRWAFYELLLYLFILLPQTLIRGTTKDGRRTFFNTADVPWVAELEKHWAVIRAELDVLLLAKEKIPNFQDIEVTQNFLTRDDRWKSYVFYNLGHTIERSVHECPRTSALIKAVPGVTYAMFSIFDGRKALAPHRGPYNGILRYHLAVKVPTDILACGIRVGRDIRHWEEGKSLLFDDSFKHEAWNNSDETRVVLFLDVLRPLPPLLDRLNRAVIAFLSKTVFVTDAVKNLKAWDRR